MPAFSAHYLFAKELLPYLRSAAVHVPLDEQALFLGAQGPDVFLFHRVFSLRGSYRGISSRLHRSRPSVFLDAMAENIGHCRDRAVWLSYAYGFLCHYALDCTVHPFVYAKQAQLKKRTPYFLSFTLHSRIEFGLDTVLLAEKSGLAKPTRFRTSALVTGDPALLSQICDLLQRSLAKALPGMLVHRSGLLGAFSDFKKMQNLLRDPHGWVRPLLQGVETVLLPLILGFCPSAMLRPTNIQRAKKRYCNVEHHRWHVPASGEVRTQSVDELWERALALAQSLIAEFNRTIATGASMKECTQDRSFLSGEPVKENEYETHRKF